MVLIRLVQLSKFGTHLISEGTTPDKFPIGRTPYFEMQLFTTGGNCNFNEQLVWKKKYQKVLQFPLCIRHVVWVQTQATVFKFGVRRPESSYCRGLMV
jgi:hypothetical protein